ncbi:hypothetical protein T552_02226 [Pneumocystis carinii B80]|uniref:Uncharacterized protein n=1 Tax=Pneumocystis carinii (strain B80) TaxID=1408658 RepID=A0A0W4ZHD4_PNEC8|nr:hypothetical protein T552_02226 [Pneumocystis carinii B80]KTW27786.1 hypothetical protein T552_02226 [Pneumocystis carinii B80]
MVYCFFQGEIMSIFGVKLGRLWGQYFPNISKRILRKRPQFFCKLFNLRFYPREDFETYSLGGKTLEKSGFRIDKRMNVYYLRGLVRVTVLASKKNISNMSSVRSRVRRRLREAARQVLLYRNDKEFLYLPISPYDLYFVANIDVLHEEWETLIDYVKKGLQKACETLNREKGTKGFVPMKIKNIESFSFNLKNKKKIIERNPYIFNAKSIVNMGKQNKFSQCNESMRLLFIRSVLRTSNPKTSIDILSKNINFLLRHYKIRKITPFDIQMLQYVSKMDLSFPELITD